MCGSVIAAHKYGAVVISSSTIDKAATIVDEACANIELDSELMDIFGSILAKAIENAEYPAAHLANHLFATMLEADHPAQEQRNLSMSHRRAIHLSAHALTSRLSSSLNQESTLLDMLLQEPEAWCLLVVWSCNEYEAKRIMAAQQRLTGSSGLQQFQMFDDLQRLLSYSPRNAAEEDRCYGLDCFAAAADNIQEASCTVELLEGCVQAAVSPLLRKAFTALGNLNIPSEHLLLPALLPCSTHTRTLLTLETQLALKTHQVL